MEFNSANLPGGSLNVSAGESAPLAAQPSPPPSTIAYQMLAGVNDGIDPTGAMMTRALEYLTGLSTGVDRNSLAYQAGSELIGPMLGASVGIAAGVLPAPVKLPRLRSNKQLSPSYRGRYCSRQIL